MKPAEEKKACCTGGSGDKERLMTPNRWAGYRAKAQVIKALAHASRLLIVDELTRKGRMCVGEISLLLGTEASTVSRHLAILRQAGILIDEKEGAMVFNRIRVGCVLDFLDCIEASFPHGVPAKAERRRLSRE